MRKFKITLLITLLALSVGAFAEEQSDADMWLELEELEKPFFIRSCIAGIKVHTELMNWITGMADFNDEEDILEANNFLYETMTSEPLDYWVNGLDTLYNDPKYKDIDLWEVLLDIIEMGY